MPDIITVLSTIYEGTMPPTVWIVNFYRKRVQSERYGPLMVATPEPSASAQGADRLALTVATMGVEVPCTIDAEDNRLRVILHLPGMLSLMSGAISALVEKQGQGLMLDDKANKTI